MRRIICESVRFEVCLGKRQLQVCFAGVAEESKSQLVLVRPDIVASLTSWHCGQM